MPSIAPIGQTAPFDRRQLQKRNAVEKHQCPVQRRLMLAGYTPISDKAAHCRLQNPIAQPVQFVRQLLIPLNAIAQRFRHFELSAQDGKRSRYRPCFRCLSRSWPECRQTNPAQSQTLPSLCSRNSIVSDNKIRLSACAFGFCVFRTADAKTASR